jgi:hypothetical protein
LLLREAAAKSCKKLRIVAARSRGKILLERNPEGDLQGWNFKSFG